MGEHAQKWARPFRSWDCKIKCISQMIWQSSRLIERFLHADSNWIIFGLATNLLCVLDTCRVSTAVLLIKNDILLLVPTWKVLELKCGKIVSCLMQYSKKDGKCIVIEPHNFKILSFLLHGYHTLQLKYILIPAIAFSPHNIKILPTHQLEFFRVSNPT